MSLPLHPALVHLPLGLAVVLPLVAAALTVAFFRGLLPRRAWALWVGLQLVLVVGALASMQTGDSDAEKIEGRVGEAPVEEHEESAERFTWAAAGVLVLGAAVFVLKRPRAFAWGAAVTTVGTLLVAGLGLLAGHAGGRLIYEHNAAAALQSSGPVGGTERSGHTGD